MQTELENIDQNEADEISMSETRLVKAIKNELDILYDKEHYGIELMIAVYEQIKLDRRTQYISQTKKDNIENYHKDKEKQSEDKQVYPVSDKQKKFIKDLGGDPNKPKDWKEASEYITELKEK